MLSPYGSRLWVGINVAADEKTRQGIANVPDPKCPTATRSVPFIVRPASVTKRGLNYLHYRNVIAQLTKMGIKPMTIEIDTEDGRIVYDGSRFQVMMREDKPKPAMSDPDSSMAAA